MPALTPLKQEKSVFFNPGPLPWAPWAMPGTYFKLLSVDEVSGRFTFLLKVDPGVVAPIHKHLGAAEGYIIEGGFGYDDDRGSAGDYVFEYGGALHVPDAPDGLLMLAIAHGPILGFNEDGTLGGIVDWQWMYDAAVAAGAADHIVLHNRFEPISNDRTLAGAA